jgi:hypothetical protein
MGYQFKVGVEHESGIGAVGKFSFEFPFGGRCWRIGNILEEKFLLK